MNYIEKMKSAPAPAGKYAITINVIRIEPGGLDLLPYSIP